MMLIAEDSTSFGDGVERGFLQEGTDSIQPLADSWFFITYTLRGTHDEPSTQLREARG